MDKVDSENVGYLDITIACKSHRLAKVWVDFGPKEEPRTEFKFIGNRLSQITNCLKFKKEKIIFNNLIYDFGGFLDQWHLQNRVSHTNI